MTTINMLDIPLSGSTGTVNFVGSTSPTLVTPILGAATATTLSFSPTTGGIIGTTTNNDTSSGNVGEFVSSVVLIGSAVNLSGSFVDTNITSISLTAGDWDVWCDGWITADASTVVVFVSFGINTTSATFNTVPATNTSSSQICGVNWTIATQFPIVPVCSCRLSLSGTTTVYFIGRASFSVSTCALYGKIMARRIR